MSESRVGLGVDAHRLVAGRPLILGGVEVPFERGLLGHSDADVLTHAICDALLGAAALGDIGIHYPDTDKRFRGISSLRLLEDVVDKLRGAGSGWRIVNVDATVLAERPTLSRYFGAMRTNLADVLGIDETRVNLKATTSETMGAIGRGEGIAAWAVCLIQTASECPDT
jgi:2-C-methyl-D-erythritol 2,4-cyclodiphosphate synthase